VSVPGAGKPGAACGLRGLVNCYKTGRPHIFDPMVNQHVTWVKVIL
jgi:phosphoketolase